MTRAALLRSAVMVATISVAASAQVPTQTLCTNTAPTLKTFFPVDSLFTNPKVTSFTITLANTVSGCPTEYRVSHYSDLHDGQWMPYSANPTMTVPSSWFPPTVNGSTNIFLYFQVRVKNPKGGFPVSDVNGTVTTAPMYFTSGTLSRKIRLFFFG